MTLITRGRIIDMSHFAYPLQRMQLPSHCGPCSLSSCFFVLGINATQREVARAAGLWPSVKVWSAGFNDEELIRAAQIYGIDHRTLFIKDQRHKARFIQRLKRHLERGTPALLLIRNLEHWVAVLGYMKKQKKYLLLDPEKNGNLFYRWTEKKLLKQAWNISNDTAEPSQYFAILWKRKDGKQPKWRLTESFLRLCERGTDDTAENMARDLKEIAKKAGGLGKSIRNGPYLADLLEEYRNAILEGISEWGEGAPNISEQDLKTFYDDYQTIAAATGIRVSRSVDRAAIVAHVTSLLSSYWWGATF